MSKRFELNVLFYSFSFSEMPTNNYVESSFWNFDSLFQPQQHPARDAHDTFFVSGKLPCSMVPVLDFDSLESWFPRVFDI